MAKFKNPVTFTQHYRVDRDAFSSTGAFDPTLQVDTRLFIDPMLIAKSGHTVISSKAAKLYRQHFLQVIRFLQKSKTKDDVAWRTAKRLLTFPEVKWTCLGYGGASITGSGSGRQMTDQLVGTAKEIIELGVEDPDLFVAMALFEAGMGPDRISDMTSRVILPALIEFSEQVVKRLDLPTSVYRLESINGTTLTASLALNPFLKKKEPVVLVPRDILRRLPVATDWDGVADAVQKNQQLRNLVNRDIARMWAVKSRKDARKLKAWATSSKSAFENFLRILRTASGAAYDFATDPESAVFWTSLADVPVQYPLVINSPASDLAGLRGVVAEVIAQFKFLVEQRRFSNDLYKDDGKPRLERASQRMFFMVAYAYCKANNLDVTPEADTDNGPVDFKFSRGFLGRVVVEIKLTTNPRLLDGYDQQLRKYREAEETEQGIYLIIDVGRFTPQKRKGLETRRNAAIRAGEQPSEIVIVDGSRQKSASKLRGSKGLLPPIKSKRLSDP